MERQEILQKIRLWNTIFQKSFPILFVRAQFPNPWKIAAVEMGA